MRHLLSHKKCHLLGGDWFVVLTYGKITLINSLIAVSHFHEEGETNEHNQKRTTNNLGNQTVIFQRDSYRSLHPRPRQWPLRVSYEIILIRNLRTNHSRATLMFFSMMLGTRKSQDLLPVQKQYPDCSHQTRKWQQDNIRHRKLTSFKKMEAHMLILKEGEQEMRNSTRWKL